MSDQLNYKLRSLWRTMTMTNSKMVHHSDMLGLHSLQLALSIPLILHWELISLEPSKNPLHRHCSRSEISRMRGRVDTKRSLVRWSTDILLSIPSYQRLALKMRTRFIELYCKYSSSAGAQRTSSDYPLMLTSRRRTRNECQG